jgi:Fibronectin type III domain
MSMNPRHAASKSPRHRGVRIVIMVAGFILAGGAAALAYWTISVTYTSNNALAQATGLSAPTSPTVTVNGSEAVTVGWSLPAGGQLTGAQYHVTRTNGPGSPVNVCTVLSTVTSCQDSGLTPGASYSYSVMAVLDTWQSTAVTTSATTSTPTLAITLSAGPYMTGTAIAVQTITAEVGGVTDATYTGSKTINWSGLANSPSGQAPSYPSSSVSFTNGVGNPGSTFLVYDAGSNTLVATDANANSVTGSSTVSLSPASLDHFTFALATPQTDGVAFSGTNTLTAQDVYNNTVTTFNASANNVTIAAVSPLTGAVSGLHGSNVLNAASDFTSGVANLTSLGMTYTGNATTGTFKATSGTKTGTSGNVTIAVGALDHFALALASPQTNGAAFTGTNTLTAQDVGNNTITGFNASANSVTITPVSPLTGAVSGLHGSNVLNLAGDFSSGVANLTSLGMTYTGNATTGTFLATSGTKTGTSGSVVVNPGALASFTFAAASPQTDGVGFTGTNTLTAKDGSGNTITGFDASANNVTITPVSPLTGAVSGLHGSNVLNLAGDFSSGVANLTSLGMTYTGNATTGTFKATSATAKTGTSGSVTIAVGALDHFTFALATPQTDGVAFSGTNTLTAQDVGNNTVTTFNASANNVTIAAVSPLTGTITGLDGAGNVLNSAADFTSGVANLTSQGLLYTGSAATGTFTATSANAKTGTSGNVTIAVGALDHFTFALATPQTTGIAFTGTNTLTAQDVGNNTITTFNASANNVTIAAVSPLTGTITGLDGAGNVLNSAADFTSGVADLTSQGMTYTGNATTGTFKATSATGSKTGTSGSVVIKIPLQYSGSSTSILTGPDYYRIDTSSTGSSTSTANSILPGVAETLRSFTFTINSASGTNHTATVGLIASGTWSATSLTCTITGGSGLTSCTVTANVSVSAAQSLNIRATGNGSHTGTWTTNYTQP